MAEKERDLKTGRFAKSMRPKSERVSKPVETVPDYGSCKACNSKLVRLLVNSRAEVPEYVLVCNNQGCNQYRIVVKE